MDEPEEPSMGPVARIGPIVVEGKDPPTWVLLIYFGPVLLASLVFGFLGPFHGWAALVAALAVGVLAYLLVTTMVVAAGLVVSMVRGYRDHRAFERDPRSFVEQRMRGRRPEPPPGPTGQGQGS